MTSALTTIAYKLCDRATILENIFEFSQNADIESKKGTQSAPFLLFRKTFRH